jgi:toxin ParE1/3/4
MRLVWSRRALRDLCAIRTYIENDNPRAAERVASVIVATAERLQDFPHLGRPTHRSDIREMLVPRQPYMLPYRVKDHEIEILAVFDERRKRPKEWV